MPAQEAAIRKYEHRDRQPVRDIMHDTAFMGEPASAFVDAREIFADALSLYFTDYEPQSCFVAEVNRDIIGCLLGAKNKAASDKIIARRIIPRIFRQAAASGALFRRKNIIFIFKSVLSLIKGEFGEPDFSRSYPATFHINVKKGYRGMEVGSKLIFAYLEYLKQEKVPAVHLATMSDRAADFFKKQGFTLLHSGRRSYFSHILHKEVPIYVYGKILG